MNRTSHISDAELQLVATEQITDTPIAAIENHIADCQQCQARLLELSAASTWREEFTDQLKNIFQSSPTLGTTPTSSFISEFNESCTTPSGDEFDLHTVDQMLREILQPPTHPEMLGRLGRYEIEGVIGCGGMGVVMRGFDRELHRPVAIKMVLPRLAKNGTAKQRFLREARAAATILHPNVISIHDISQSSDVPWFVMPLVIGPSLKTLVEKNGALNERDVVRIGLQIAGGLSAAHSKGLVHRDIKPENILVDNQVNRVVITDFGLARRESEEAMTQTGMLAGTLNYMSPEQSCGADIDIRSDLFSLGSVLYFLATGVAPFYSNVGMRVLHKIRTEQHASVQSLNPEISATLSAVVDRLLAKSPNDRFQTAAELEAFLNDYLAYLHHPTQMPVPKIPGDRNKRPITFKPNRKLTLPMVTSICFALFAWWTIANWKNLTSPGPGPRSPNAQNQWDQVKSRYQLDDQGIFLSEIESLERDVRRAESMIEGSEQNAGISISNLPDESKNLESDMSRLAQQINSLESFKKPRSNSPSDNRLKPGAAR